MNNKPEIDTSANHLRSVPALILGTVASSFISAGLVIATAKAGISPGVSPLVVLVGWVTLGNFFSARLKPVLSILQVTGSGGASVSAGLIFTAPIVQIAAKVMGQPVPQVDIVTTLLSCLAGSLLGWGFVGLATKRFLLDTKLPAPEAVACGKLIEAASQSPFDRPSLSRSLIPAIIAGIVANLLILMQWIDKAAATIRVPLPGISPAHALSFSIPVSPLYIGIGALLTSETAVLIFCGGIVNAFSRSIAAHQGMDSETYRWVGGAAMVVAVLYSLASYMLGAAFPTESRDEPESRQLEIPARMRAFLYAGILAGGAILALVLSKSNLSAVQFASLFVLTLFLVSLLSGLGGLLSLQVGASASPVSGTVFMAMLALSLAAVGLSLSGFAAIEVLHPILVTACVAIAAANDSSQDYKTIQLTGYPVHRAFLPQLLGCLAGALTVPFSLALAHEAFGLGTEELPCPQASFFSVVLTSLFDLSAVPFVPVAVGALLGGCAVGLEMYAKRHGLILSSLAFAVGIYLPAEIGIGALLGNSVRMLATGSRRASASTGILAAAGLIAADSLFALGNGGAILMGFQMPSSTTAPSNIGGMVCVVVILGLVGWASQTEKR